MIDLLEGALTTVEAKKADKMMEDILNEEEKKLLEV